MEFALRDVKEYAARSHDLNVDSLQLKLIHLEDLGRCTMHEDRELYSKVLERFQVRKDHPKVGSLILTLLSSSTDALVFNKEHKFLKLHGKDRQNPAQDKGKKSGAEDSSGVDWQMMYVQAMQMLQFAQPRFPMTAPQPRPPLANRRLGPVRPRLQNYMGCHNCGDMSHFRVDCPKLKYTKGL